ncbi:MAG: thiol oxidoreductase [Candidatus Kapabacteria bacterium]|nr:thiol oxidoreductase [Candidatus Kapabacteria bacterium]
MSRFLHSSIIALVSLLMLSCDAFYPAAPAEDALLDGPIPGLTREQTQIFLRGDTGFNDLVFTSQTGLGPTFVANSCGSCHAGDGKGHPFTTLVRFGQRDASGNSFLDQGGPQLQNRAIPGYSPESIPAGAPSARFTPPANTGLGYFDFIPDESILANADPTDTNGDGISGVPNWVVLPGYTRPRTGTVYNGIKVVGRYGKKASTYDLLQQTVNAFNQDIGITSEFAPVDVYSGVVIGPEVSTQTINDIVFYLHTLKAPIQRTPTDATVKKGAEVFATIGCNGCHLPTMKTGPAPISSLSNMEFHPYSDLLLHDMGSGLDDGYTEGSATSAEWRTPPLWGLGLSSNSQGGSYFLMHDGRARSIDEAIRLHSGEAQRSASLYIALSIADTQAIIKFLESL